MEEKYYGIDGRFIPRNEIPFNFKLLKTNDIIENKEKTRQLMYFEEDGAYQLMNNNLSEFLSITQLQQSWIKE